MNQSKTIIGFPESTVVTDVKESLEKSSDVIILHPDDFLAGNYNNETEFINCVFLDRDLRDQISQELTGLGLTRLTYVHPTSSVSSSAVISPGTYVAQYVTIGCNAVIGQDSMIAPYCCIGHNTVIGDNCVMHTNAIIAGSCRVGKNCRFNLRSTVIDKLNISDDVIVSAGALATKDLEVAGQYVGSPCRKVK